MVNELEINKDITFETIITEINWLTTHNSFLIFLEFYFTLSISSN